MASIEELAQEIASNTSVISKFLKENGHPTPSFEADGPLEFPDAPADVVAAREALLVATSDLQTLVQYPRVSMSTYNITGMSFVAMHFISHFNIAEAVPLTGKISYSDLAKKTGLYEQKLIRVVRFAITRRVFKEPSPGFVAHTVLSAGMVRDPGIRNYVAFATEIILEGMPYCVQAAQKYGDNEIDSNTPLNLALGVTDLPVMEAWATNRPKEFEIFQRAMHFSITSPEHVAEGYDWAGLGKGTLVDVGGGHGHVSVAIARVAPELDFVVQDLGAAVEGGRAALPSDLKERFTFMEHNFFQPNPVKEANAYFFRCILHDWPDRCAADILRGVVAAMGPRSKVLLCDQIMPEPGTIPLEQQRRMRDLDMTMLGCNGVERSLDQWTDLLDKVGLKITAIHSPKGTALSIIEAGRKDAVD